MQKLATSLFLLAAAAPAAALAVDRAGVSAGVRGEVARVASAAGEPVGGKFKGGESVFMGDGIESGTQSGMQVLLLDQTTFTIGPDSRIVIDEFVFDPKANAGKVGASILRGGFRFVSGKIAAKEPSDMVVKTPVATIGVRGTAVFGIVTPTETIIALAGPGRNNNSQDKVAGVDIFTSFGTSELRRAGFAVRIVPGQPPEIIRLTPEMLQRLEAALGPTGSSGTSGPRGGQAQQGSGGIGQVAGIGTLGGHDFGRTLETLRGIETTGTYFRSDETRRTDNVETQRKESTDLQNVNLAFDAGDFTTFQQLLSVTSGVGTYSSTGVAMVGTGASGSYNFDATLDFGMQTISGTFSSINVTGTLTVSNGSVPLSQSYAGFNFPSIAGAANSVGCGTGITCTGVVTFQNSGSNIAATAVHALQVTDGVNVAIGTGTAAKGSGGF